MEELGFVNLLIVAAAAFTAPFVLGLAPALRIPAVVLEIVTGIVIGPAGLGWVEVDPPVEVLALVGLAFLLFLAGLEIEVDRLRGRDDQEVDEPELFHGGLVTPAGEALRSK